MKYGDITSEKLLELEKSEIEKSWEKIFDMDFYDSYVTHKIACKSIQATFWELRIDEVVKVDEFKAR